MTNKEKEKEQDKISSEKVRVFIVAVNYTTSTDYGLQDSFILDSEAIVHVVIPTSALLPLPLPLKMIYYTQRI